MAFCMEYETNLIGKLTLASDGESIVGCWFGDNRFLSDTAEEPLAANDELPVLREAMEWLDLYFAGGNPAIGELSLKPHGTDFRHLVWAKLRKIPYGMTVTYGDIARQLERETGKRVSAQAVGGAVGRNPIGVIVPCHRVMGAGGNLAGFGGGIDVKIKLLELEGIDTTWFHRPR